MTPSHIINYNLALPKAAKFPTAVLAVATALSAIETDPETGRVEVRTLDLADALGVSDHTVRNARTWLMRNGYLDYWNRGHLRGQWRLKTEAFRFASATN